MFSATSRLKKKVAFFRCFGFSVVINSGFYNPFIWLGFQTKPCASLFFYTSEKRYEIELQYVCITMDVLWCHYIVSSLEKNNCIVSMIFDISVDFSKYLFGTCMLSSWSNWKIFYIILLMHIQNIYLLDGRDLDPYLNDVLLLFINIIHFCYVPNIYPKCIVLYG